MITSSQSDLVLCNVLTETGKFWTLLDLPKLVTTLRNITIINNNNNC